MWTSWRGGYHSAYPAYPLAPKGACPSQMQNTFTLSQGPQRSHPTYRTNSKSQISSSKSSISGGGETAYNPSVNLWDSRNQLICHQNTVFATQKGYG